MLFSTVYAEETDSSKFFEKVTDSVKETEERRAKSCVTAMINNLLLNKTCNLRSGIIYSYILFTDYFFKSLM
jgi:hypothetical protein